MGYHDLWRSDKEQYAKCPGYLETTKSATNNVLAAYYYTGSANPTSTPLVDLDSKFNANIKVPYIDGTFPFKVVLRLVFAFVLSSIVYIVSLLRSLRRIRKHRSRLEYGPLIFCQPGLIAGILSGAWLMVPTAIYLYLFSAGVAPGAEGILCTFVIAAATGWLLREAYLFRVNVLLHGA